MARRLGIISLNSLTRGRRLRRHERWRLGAVGRQPLLLQWWGGASTLSDATRSREDVNGGGADDGASMGAMLGFRSVVCVWAVCCWDLITLPNLAHVRKLKNQEGSKIYVKVRLLRILFQRGFQKSTILLAPSAELNSCKNSSQRRYCKFPNRLISSLFILRRSGTKKNKREISHPVNLHRSCTKKNKREISHPVILRILRRSGTKKNKREMSQEEINRFGNSHTYFGTKT
jgi:hypothetical protein